MALAALPPNGHSPPGLGGRLHSQCPWPLLDKPATDEGVHSVNSDPPTEADRSRPSTAEVSREVSREVSLQNLAGTASPTKVSKTAMSPVSASRLLKATVENPMGRATD